MVKGTSDLRVSDYPWQVQWSGFRVLGLGFWVSGVGFRVWGFGFRYREAMSRLKTLKRLPSGWEVSELAP